MAYGFSVVNSDNNIIISDYTKNFHFFGRATLTGNSGGAFGSFPGYSGQYSTLDGRVIFYYDLVCVTEPLVFIKPVDYSRYHALIRKYQTTDGVWHFQVMVTGTSTANPPILNCFTDANTAGFDSVPGFGLVIYKNSIERTFDTRYSPLAIQNSGYHIPLDDPTDSPGTGGTSSGYPWNYNTLDHDFRSTTRYQSYTVDGNYQDLMFATPSLAQATYHREIKGYKKSKASSWDPTSQEHWSNAKWWVMYRNVFMLTSNPTAGKATFRSGWGPFAAGYQFESRAEDGGWFGGDGKSYSTGAAPYPSKTINLLSNVFLTADSRPYV